MLEAAGLLLRSCRLGRAAGVPGSVALPAGLAAGIAAASGRGVATGEPARDSEGGSEAGEEYGERRFVEHGEDVSHEGDVSLHEGESDEEAVASGGLRAGAAA